MWHRILLFSIIPFGILFVWIWQDVSPAGEAVYYRETANMTARISQYYPEGRLSEPVIVNNSEYQKVLGEPIYFDVRIPRVMDEIKVNVSAIGDIKDLKIGLRLPPSITQEWRYKIEQPTIIDLPDTNIVTHTFNLTESYVEKGKVRFILSIPQGQEIFLGKLEVFVSGDDLTISDIMKSIKQRLRI
jgi:hypothetical protein